MSYQTVKVGKEQRCGIFCEVIVNIVLKRDAILPHPYAEMSTMADAHVMSIICPYRKASKASRSSLGTAGTSGRNARRLQAK
ncbi:unnamed protein product [Urochloa humidicola]